MRTKIALLSTLSILLLTSCQRGCQSLSREFEATDSYYRVVMFSGGDTVFIDNFKGIVNNSESSDGVYYYKGDTLIEVSGDYTIHSIK